MDGHNNNGEIDTTPVGFLVHQGTWFCLILVTHDELTFYAHD